MSNTDLYQLITDDPVLKRKADRLTKRASVAISSDRRFFEAHPDRDHRVRVSHPAEIKLLSVLAERPVEREPGLTHYTVIRQIYPGYRLRLFVTNTEGMATVDLTEEEALGIYEEHATEYDRAVEARLRDTAERLGATNPDKRGRP